jgi:hypothetical protein
VKTQTGDNWVPPEAPDCEVRERDRMFSLLVDDSLGNTFYCERWKDNEFVDRLRNSPSDPINIYGPIEFGAHKGTSWWDVPKGYLLWVWRTPGDGWWERQRQAAKHVLELRDDVI